VLGNKGYHDSGQVYCTGCTLHFLLNVYYGSNFCPTLLETAPLREPNRNLRDFTLFNIDLTHRNCPSASSVSDD